MTDRRGIEAVTEEIRDAVGGAHAGALHGFAVVQHADRERLAHLVRQLLHERHDLQLVGRQHRRRDVQPAQVHRVLDGVLALRRIGHLVLALVVPLAVGRLAPQAVVEDGGDDGRLIVRAHHEQRPTGHELRRHFPAVLVVGRDDLHLGEALHRVQVLGADAVDQRELARALRKPDAMGLCRGGRTEASHHARRESQFAESLHCFS
jgi:hypothetical protein